MGTIEQPPWLGEEELHRFEEGADSRAYEKLGAHPAESGGTHFAVWAPNAAQVAVIGEFNAWCAEANPLSLDRYAGVWEAFVPQAQPGALYKYRITPLSGGPPADKADPYAFAAEPRPQSASIICDLDTYQWNDAEWMAHRAAYHALDRPISIYQVDLASWRRVVEEGNRTLTYRETAPLLADYVHEAGYTHVEFLTPLAPGSFYAPAGRFGSPADCMYLVDCLHQRGIGVILDWPPAHFPEGEAGLRNFDGAPLYEDPRVTPPQFDYGRPQVREFLTGSALFWLGRYHVDALRLDAVARMVYLDYGRAPGQWTPNRHGGPENLEALAFLRQLNEQVYAAFPDCQTIAAESDAWPMVSRPTYAGGLGFGLLWNTGWTRGILEYLVQDPIHRRHYHHQLTFSTMSAFAENFVLPLSYQEVACGHGSLLARMPGDEWRRFANLRLLFAWQFGHPGKKLLFMGDDFGQWNEWRPDARLDWHLLQYPLHAGMARWVRDLNTFYRAQPSLHQLDCESAGFEWVDAHDLERCVAAFLRRARDPDDATLLVFNFTPVPRANYRVGAPQAGYWEECLNSDAPLYGGSGQGNIGGVEAAPLPLHGQPFSLSLTLPPLGALLLRPSPDRKL
ncbi:MAG TPA: 1,4-alpha-glucan branching protein GlgB [Bryobacteraceae bacterium]|nr:1,4-alpha-glucan branching protein GlgB [Bryobacteraceae bacterium]